LGRARSAMSKFILISTVLAMVVLPIIAAREKDAQKGLKKLVVRLLAFQVLYLLALRFLWGRF
jgi:hypothetical protein